MKYIYLGVFLRIVVSIWEGFFGPSFFGGSDSGDFHQVAVDYSLNPNLSELQIGWVYANFLGLFYYLTAPLLFLGCLLSCIAWFFSAIIIKKCLEILQIEAKIQKKALLIYALLPTSIFITSITLRESYQLLFVNLAIFSMLKIYFYKSLWHWFLLFFATICGGALHGALLAFGVLFVSGTFILLLIQRAKSGVLIKLSIMLFFALIVLFYGSLLFKEISYDLSDGLVNSVEKFQRGSIGNEARTNYRELDSSIGNLFVFVPFALFQYLFEPLPWKITTIADIELFCENLLRAWLIIQAIKLLMGSINDQKRIAIFLFSFYLILEVIWSLGTINWGTACRHHLPSWGMLLIIAFASVSAQKTVKTQFVRV